jgi:hypothetical protein
LNRKTPPSSSFQPDQSIDGDIWNGRIYKYLSSAMNYYL